MLVFCVSLQNLAYARCLTPPTCDRVSITRVLVCSADNADVGRQMEEAESRASQLNRSKTLLQSQLEELKKQLDEEVKVSVCVCVCVCVCV